MVKVTNRGVLPVKLEAVAIAPSPEFDVQGWSGPVTLLAGQSYQMLVGFRTSVPK
jgi:hypothetical protein